MKLIDLFFLMLILLLCGGCKSLCGLFCKCEKHPEHGNKHEYYIESGHLKLLSPNHDEYYPIIMSGNNSLRDTIAVKVKCTADSTNEISYERFISYKVGLYEQCDESDSIIKTNDPQDKILPFQLRISENFNEISTDYSGVFAVGVENMNNKFFAIGPFGCIPGLMWKYSAEKGRKEMLYFTKDSSYYIPMPAALHGNGVDTVFAEGVYLKCNRNEFIEIKEITSNCDNLQAHVLNDKNFIDLDTGVKLLGAIKFVSDMCEISLPKKCYGEFVNDCKACSIE